MYGFLSSRDSQSIITIHTPKFGWHVSNSWICFANKLSCLSKSRQSYRLLNNIQWTFGQKLVTSNATFWATDSQYTCATSETASRRRDKFLLRGTEPCEVTLPNGDVIVKSTALCCESVCFVRLDDLDCLRTVFPAIPGRYILLLTSVLWSYCHTRGLIQFVVRTDWPLYEDMRIASWGHIVIAMGTHVTHRGDSHIHTWGHMSNTVGTRDIFRGDYCICFVRTHVK